MWFLKKSFFRTVKKFLKNKGGKYSLEDFDQSFSVLKNVQLVSGVGLLRHDDSDRKRFWLNFYYWFTFVNIFIPMVLEFASMVKTAMEGSLLAIFLMMPCVNYLVLANAKTYKLVIYKPVYESIIQELREMWPVEDVAEEEDKIINKSLRQINTVVNVYYWANTALLSLFTFPPYITVAKKWLGQDVKLALSFLFLLPFDQYQDGVYEAMVVLQTWQCLVTIWSMMTGDLVFCILLGHITTQFDLLAVRIRKLFYVPLDKQLLKDYPLGKLSQNFMETEKNVINTYDRKQWFERHHKEMIEIILRHRALIRLSEGVEQQFSFAMLLNFMSGSIIICFCGFCCVFVEKWNVIVYKTFLLTAILEIWLLCWFGQKLQDSSVGVADAFYNSGWYEASGKIKLLMLIMMHRGQKAVRITTYGFSVISLSSFSSIIRTSWSYFTLLINVVK